MSSISTLLGLQGFLSLPLTILYLGHYIFFHVLLLIFFYAFRVLLGFRLVIFLKIDPIFRIPWLTCLKNANPYTVS